MSDLRTYVNKTNATVVLAVDRVDADRVRIKSVRSGKAIVSQVLSNAEAAKLVADLGLLAAPDPVPDPAPSGAWAWDAKNALIDSEYQASRVISNCNNPNLVMTSWAVATADAKSGDPEYSIPRTKQGGSITVRIPLGTKPDSSGDGHLTVRDVERGIETDFWQASYDSASGKIKSTSAAVSFPLGQVNTGTTGWTGNAANTPLRRGLVRPDDLKVAIDANGHLPYTLQHSIPNIAIGTYRYPALHNAPTGNNSSVVEGTWTRLDPTVNVDALAIPEWEKVIARTLQIHGAVNRDNGGTFGIYGENPLNRNASWSLVGLSGGSAGFSAAFPWASVQVLRPPT